MICEQPRGEINFCVQGICLSLRAIWCLIFKGGGKSEKNWTETNITPGKERHFFYRREPMGTLSMEQIIRAVPSFIYLRVRPN